MNFLLNLVTIFKDPSGEEQTFCKFVSRNHLSPAILNLLNTLHLEGRLSDFTSIEILPEKHFVDIRDSESNQVNIHLFGDFDIGRIIDPSENRMGYTPKTIPAGLLVEGVGWMSMVSCDLYLWGLNYREWENAK